MKNFLFGIIGFVLWCGTAFGQTYIQGPALIQGHATVPTGAGTTTLTSTSQTWYIFTGTLTQTVKLMDATTIPAGRSIYIINQSSVAINIQDNSGGALETLGSGAAAIFYSRSKATVAGAWSIITAGTIQGILPVASGGTNSGTALNSQRVMQSASGKIVEAAAITANRALASDLNGIPVASATTDTELGYVSGVTSSIQTQLNAVAPPPTGAILMYGNATAPAGFTNCDGSAISRTTFAALFAVIGTTYGAGNGTTTFNVPNLQALVPRGTGTQTVNARTKTGPTLGAVQEDQFQGHWHNYQGFAQTSNSTGGWSGLSTGGTVLANIVKDAVSDGTNGTPRTGLETRVSSLGVNFIIKD